MGQVSGWFSSPPTYSDPLASSDPAEFAKRQISDNKVMIFSKTWCPYCRKVKSLFDSISVQYSVVELDQIENGDSIQAALTQKYTQRTVPFVFVGQKLVGGSDATHAAWNNGQLKTLLADIDRRTAILLPTCPVSLLAEFIAKYEFLLAEVPS